MSYSSEQVQRSRRQRAKGSTVWAAMKEKTAQGQRPLRVPPQGDLNRAYPRLVSEKQRRQFSESELRTAAEMFAKLQRGEDLRMEKVERVRNAITAQDYENEMKLDIAADRLLLELME